MSAFHFLRPEAFWLLIPAALLWWVMLRGSDSAGAWRQVIAPHLLPHLLTGQDHGRQLGPVILMGILWLLGTLAIAGPTWRKEPSPFAEDVAPIGVVLRVSSSMTTEDLQPDRLTRSKQKIDDLLKLRQGARAALVAYNGSAHLVMPPTVDAQIINSFAEPLTPDIMPEEGDAAANALKLAENSLSSSGGGSLIWITDSITQDQEKQVRDWLETSHVPICLLAPLPPGRDLDALEAAADRLEIPLQTITPDDTDVERLARDARFAASLDQSGEHWRESGYWLTPLILGLALFFFRKGWVIPAVQS